MVTESAFFFIFLRSRIARPDFAYSSVRPGTTVRLTASHSPIHSGPAEGKTGWPQRRLSNFAQIPICHSFTIRILANRLLITMGETELVSFSCFPALECPPNACSFPHLPTMTT